MSWLKDVLMGGKRTAPVSPVVLVKTGEEEGFSVNSVVKSSGYRYGFLPLDIWRLPIALISEQLPKSVMKTSSLKETSVFCYQRQE